MSGPCLQVEREIALHSRLRPRNIVAFHGHFADRDHVYMVLEYCSRQSLAHVLRAWQTLTKPEVRYYLRGLVSGLRYLHQPCIVHRDLKLSNFFLNKNMEVKIGDLGLAAKVGPGGRCHRYMVLTGTPPFMASPLSEMYQNIREGHYPEPAHLSANARCLIAHLLAPNPAERPSLDHLLQDDFFTQGFTPDRLPAHSCHSAPIFAIPPPLGRIFWKVGQRLLTQCRPPSTQDPPGEQQPILWAPKWVDYSSKYGFGYQLSDGGSGVLLRDGTHMAPRPPRGQVCYMPDCGRLETFALRDVPGPLGAKLAVLQLFAGCLQRRLREEGTLPTPVPPAGPGLCLLRFLASEQALLLLFSNGMVQVSFSGVPAQLVLSGEGEGLQLTLWEQGSPGTSYSLDVLRSHGCAPTTRQHLHHALRMLQSIQCP
ncbi:PLK5 isoform 5 [Pan troglodytes]|uniref:PLK5 isoform 5 n=1 Tax=Pan troglodytes TaxID=9598 RepID=A0A2J8J1X1_PANTR|nr:PLK5 isoform 5 [Pan troglodytes]